MEREGSKVQMMADALEMLGEVWTVRRARTGCAHGKGNPDPMVSPFEAAVSAADPPLGPVSTSAGVPPALQAS